MASIRILVNQINRHNGHNFDFYQFRMTKIHPLAYLISVMLINIAMILTVDMQNPALTYVWFFTLTDIILVTLFILLYTVSTFLAEHRYRASRLNQTSSVTVKAIEDLFAFVSYISIILSFIIKGFSIPIGLWHIGLMAGGEFRLATVFYLSANIVIVGLLLEAWFRDDRRRRVG